MSKKTFWRVAATLYFGFWLVFFIVAFLCYEPTTNI